MRQSSQFTVALLRRIREFLERTQPAFALGEIKLHLEGLTAVTDGLSALVVEQDTRHRQGKIGTSTLRRRLRAAKFEYMRPVARMARALFPDDPQLRSALSIPPRLARPEAVLAALHAMSIAAEPHKEAFVAAGFAADFLERMHVAADSLKEAVDARAKEFGRRSAASVGAVRTATRGRALIGLIDAMLAPRLESNPELLAEWRSLLRQGRLRVLSPGPAVPVVPAPPNGGPVSPSIPAPATPAPVTPPPVVPAPATTPLPAVPAAESALPSAA